MWQEKLDSDIYLIPVRLEDCEVPESLRDFQWVDLFEEDGWTLLIRAIQVGMARQREVVQPIIQKPRPFETYPAREMASPSTEMATLREGSERVHPLKLTPTPTERLAKLWSLLWSDTLSRIMLVFLSVLTAVAAVLWLIYCQPYVSKLQHSPAGVDFAVKYYPWLTVGEENSVEITLVNKNNIQLEKVKAYLVFSGTLPICHTSYSISEDSLLGLLWA